MLLKSMDVTKERSFARLQILGHLEELIAPLAWLEQSLAPYRAHLDRETEAFIVWAWQHRHALHIDVDDLTDVPADVASAFWSTLELFHRASSLAQSLHSWLRPHHSTLCTQSKSHRSQPSVEFSTGGMLYRHPCRDVCRREFEHA
jgi:hypothetical protein